MLNDLNYIDLRQAITSNKGTIIKWFFVLNTARKYINFSDFFAIFLGGGKGSKEMRNRSALILIQTLLFQLTLICL